MNLYDLAPALENIQRAIENCDGEIAADLDTALSSLVGTVEEKVGGVVAMVKNLDSESEALGREIARLGFLRIARINKAVWLKEYLKKFLEQTSIDKVTNGIHGCRIQNNSQPTVDVKIEAEELPDRFRESYLEWRIKRDVLLDEWKKTGEAPEGVSIVVGKHLRII